MLPHLDNTNFLPISSLQSQVCAFTWNVRAHISATMVIVFFISHYFKSYILICAAYGVVIHVDKTTLLDIAVQADSHRVGVVSPNEDFLALLEQFVGIIRQSY